MLQNAYFLAKIGADTAENEQHFAEILPTDALWRLHRGVTGRRAARRRVLPRERGQLGGEQPVVGGHERDVHRAVLMTGGLWIPHNSF